MLGSTIGNILFNTRHSYYYYIIFPETTFIFESFIKKIKGSLYYKNFKENYMYLKKG